MAGHEGSFMAVRRIQHGIDRGRGFHSSPADLVNGSATWIGRGFSCVCVQKRDGDARISFELTPFQEECWNRLQRRIEVCYDGLKIDHQESLMNLWRVSFPEVELLDLISEQWKKMGWQGKDPSTDFRGGGFISLENLLFFAKTFPNSYRSLLLKEEGERATWEYPFAVAGVNITFMLIQLLDLQLEKPRTIIGAIFLKLLSENPKAFDILYCITFKMMDQQWLSLRATYMDFNTVMRRGVNRGPVQCRKRWSNLAGDYKKIKEWELKKRSEAAGEDGDDEKESFWVMRNDLRRERKLPGFFDREVFDILDGKEVELPPVKEGVGRGGGNSKEDSSGAVGGDGAAGREIAVVEEEDEDKEEAAAVFDSGRTTADDGLFTDSDDDDKGKDDGRSSPLPTPSGVPVAVTPISERKFDPSFASGSDKDRGKEKTAEREGRPMGGRKRQREGGVSEETRGEKESILQQQLVDILDRNSRMMTEQLEVQNVNCRLDREQRADMARSVVEVLGKLAEAIGKIAEKL